jgi:ABC-type dipeptide/oligopeptide/nickel transport system permease component
LLNRKKWTLQLGLFAALLTLVAGIPLGVVTTMESAKFSMYFLAPILALVLKIIFILPKSNTMLTQWIDGTEKTS